MAQQDRTTLKGYFNTGDVPTEAQFADLIDSGHNPTDDGAVQVQPTEGAFADGDKTKLDGIETAADVTDTANVTAAGALMDSEVTNLADVKAFDPADYATSTQGGLADTAVQPAAISDFEATSALNTRDTNNRARENHTGTQTASTISDFSTAADARIEASDKVSSDPTGVTGADQITNMMSLTQAEYDAITPDPHAGTFYVVTA